MILGHFHFVGVRANASQALSVLKVARPSTRRLSATRRAVVFVYNIRSNPRTKFDLKIFTMLYIFFFFFICISTLTHARACVHAYVRVKLCTYDFYS